MDLELGGWMVGWNPGEPDKVMVGPWPDRSGWSFAYRYTDGCCMLARHKLSVETQTTLVFVTFNTLVVRDGMDARAVHREFLKIGAYRRRISPDIVGAEV